MLLTALASVALAQTGAWPENPSVDYSGIPSISGGNISVVSHNVQLELFERYANVTSTTLVKNNGGVGNASIGIPRNRIGDEKSGSPTFEVKATWVNQPLKLNPGVSTRAGSGKNSMFSNYLVGTGPMKAGGSYALRISYLVPLGKAGFDRKKLLAAYGLTSAHPIGVLMCSYKYAKGTVFRLPEVMPSEGWQVGDRGVFMRRENFTGVGVSNVSFYPGGFKNIGDGN